MRYGLRDIERAHALRAVSRTQVQKGGERLAKEPMDEAKQLHTTVASVRYHVFIAGIHDPTVETDVWIG